MEYWVDILNQALIFAIYAVSLSLLVGYAGQFSVATVAVGGVGGYTAAALSVHHGVAFVPALVAAVLLAAFAGAVLSLPAVRLGSNHLLLFTLAFATVIGSAFSAIHALGGTEGLLGMLPVKVGGGPLLRPTQLLPVVGALALGTYLVALRVGTSPFGRVLKAIREDSVVTEALGKNVDAYKVATFALTSGMAGLAGAMVVYYNQVASPQQFGFSVETTVFAAVVVGGIASLTGSALGALVLVFIGPVLQKVVKLAPDRAALWQLAIYGFLLLLIVRLRPDGVVPEGGLRLVRRLRGTDRAPAPAAAAPSVAVVREPLEPRAPVPDAVPILEARGITKHFSGIAAVTGFSLELAEGTTTALVGPNGAGKTTVFNLLTGRIAPDAGSVFLRGRDITGLPSRRTARLGLVRSYQDVRTLTRLSVLENVMLGVPGQTGERMRGVVFRPLAVRRAELATRDRARECLAYVGLEERADEPAGSLGYGDQKLLAISRLLATDSDVLLVDEPAAGIDRGALEPVLVVLERLRAEGKTICLVEHNLDVVARLAERVLFMEQGTVTATGTMAEIAQQERLAEVYFGHTGHA